ncbi:hypothetical protein [Sporosarcina pasteurii]|uniref:General secretion pathway, M protein n=1 Tax=Sporosarcina pasteurii TaxID=1474 RepID=A0A380BXC3_SPOPA|nr:hypothetical protein [Sporosarcina pasteurii]MDS9471332.1 hypothetical protein [Sporosarcina pasteurii]QBQ05040.1 hypothetical protein E2C16_04855 [Sporosarcina pasteurii]SUJ07812.1 Uncharacterised protein [Sporosarcina pasteurii]
MNISFKENRTLLILLLVLAFVIVGAIYFYTLYPKMEEKKRVLQSIDTIEIEIEQLNQKLLSTSDVKAATEHEFELRKKLPEKREISSLLMSLQEIELVSEAKINEIIFHDYDALVSQSGLVEDVDSEEENEKDKMDDEKGEIPVTNIDIAALPKQLKLLTLQMDVDVKDKAHLLHFIQEIEALERVIRVDDIRFTLDGEADLAVKEPDETINIMLQITTFYSEVEAN